MIHLAEIAPAELSLRVWRERLSGRRVILFVDNEAAKGALIKGTSSTVVAARLVHKFWETISSLEAHVWVDRVPSLSNCGDGPSRGQVAVVRRLRRREVACAWPGPCMGEGGESEAHARCV